jgi:hypothetical protein
VVDLPAPLGPTNPVICPGTAVTVMPSQRHRGPEPLAQAADFDSRFHASHGRQRRPPRSSRWGAVFGAPGSGNAGTAHPSHEGRLEGSPGDANPLAGEDSGHVSQLVGWRGGWAGALRRIAAFPHAPAAAGALLAVAAVTQAIALSASNDGISGSDREIVFVLWRC